MRLKDFDCALMDARLGALRAAPEEILLQRLDRLPISVRLCNLLKCVDCRTVSDLIARGTAPVVGSNGFGKLMGSELERLVSALIDHAKSHRIAIEETEPQTASTAQLFFQPPSSSLLEQIEGVLLKLLPRDALVWKARSGYDGKIKTLEVIAAGLGITRERARQLELRAADQMLKWAPAYAEISATLTSLLYDRSEPLSVESLTSGNRLFEGLKHRPLLFAELVQKTNRDEFHVWELNGVSIVSQVSASDWQRLKRHSEKTLSSAVKEGITQARVHGILLAMASSNGAPELGQSLFDALQPRLHFGTAIDGEERKLVAVGRSMPAALTSILEGAAQPLSLAEIARQFKERTGTTGSKMGLRNALNSIGAHVFSRRRYGLDKHSMIPLAAIDPIIETVHQVMATGSAGRQWHCVDLAETIREMRPDLSEGLDPYTLNIVLGKASHLQALGRLVWRTGHTSEMQSEDRRSISELCVDLLESAGKPLKQAVLARKIREVRGLGDNFMPQPNRFMARLRHGVWGLLSRDFPFSPGEQRPILNRLEAALRSRSKALHASEVTYAISLETDRPLKLGRAIFGMAQTDDRFRTGRGHLIGLASWASLGRYNSYSAIKEAAKRIHDFVTPEKLYKAVDTLAERHVSRDRIAAELKALGYKYEIKGRRWVHKKPVTTEMATKSK